MSKLSCLRSVHVESPLIAYMPCNGGIPVIPPGAAHNSRSTAGTPSALHQQHLTPTQQATQAAITAPATHQDGKVPVRTGLAWAALGTTPICCLGREGPTAAFLHLPCTFPVCWTAERAC